jgi:recombinational DNA repair protein RecT
MAKKTAVRRLTKMLPLSSEIREHVEKDDERTFEPRNVTPRPGFAAAIAAPVEPTAQESFEAELAREEEA